MNNTSSLSENRTRKAKYNIIISLLLKGFSLIISFVLIPLTIGYLSQYEYGVWLTLSAFLHWTYYILYTRYHYSNLISLL